MNGCSVTQDIEITETDELVVDYLQSNYANYGVSCNGGLDGWIDLQVAGGTGNYSYSWSHGASTEDASNLPAGTYSVVISDQNGCSYEITDIQLMEPLTPMTISETHSEYSGYGVSCNGSSDGFIDITVSGGNIAGNANYTYVWSTTDGSGLIQGEEDQSGLGPGTYTVSVTDENNCTATQSFTLTQAQPLNYVLDRKQDITCFGDDDGAIEISVTDGTGVYTYDWSTTNGSGLVQGQQDQSGLSPGDYKLILSDSCTTLEYNYTIRSPGAVSYTHLTLPTNREV